MTRYLAAFLLLPVLLFAVLPSAAASDDGYIDGKVITAGYLSHHPDLRHRIDGMKALDAGFPREALADFVKSARFADKPAQAMLANMYWEGVGTEVDRPRGYAWMDIAAERGYPDFLAWRERYWAALSPDEQREAIRIGQPLMDEYGDRASKPRIAKELKRGKRRQTGSRIGGSGAGVQIKLVGPSAGGTTAGFLVHAMSTTIDGEDYYQARYWEPKEYFAWQDRQWGVENTGHVDVLPLERVADDVTD